MSGGIERKSGEVGKVWTHRVFPNSATSTLQIPAFIFTILQLLIVFYFYLGGGRQEEVIFHGIENNSCLNHFVGLPSLLNKVNFVKGPAECPAYR